jgi:hypothetical protein
MGKDVGMLRSMTKTHLVAVAALISLAGCTSPTTTTPSPATPTGSANGPATTPVATTAPASAKQGCPVDASTLEQAFKANADLAGAIVLGGGLRKVTCYQDFAVAVTTPTEVDPATVLFSYDKAKGVWTAVTGGTAISCGEHGVPAAVISHLPGCRSE